jgi:hypothetical protein
MESLASRGYTRDRRPLAPSGLSCLLEVDFEIPKAGGEKTDFQGNTVVDLPHGG